MDNLYLYTPKKEKKKKKKKKKKRFTFFSYRTYYNIFVKHTILNIILFKKIHILQLNIINK
ncbi:hypothetical protein PFUGPA_00798 [Plasmodium falciparum Palo Alto/Uganda]|uniref:Uncharacterized protein n=1 Tax=Plasmodium falciparum (isolate Palo Alto / Uganda) TaxID=57270 RepID=W4J5I7_PLAFP|nr:hypothetical protein PFUGPA_00798 [Plasmodium falciparum Palo Alto/Uganda]